MNVLVLTNNCASLPCLELLARQQQLSAIYTPLPYSPDSVVLEDWAAARAIPFFGITREDLAEELNSFTGEFRNHLVLVFGFPWKIPAALLEGSRHRFYNMHFSLLPAYAGPAPLFWQLREGCREGGVTLHQLSARLDGGPIYRQTGVRLIPGETAGLYAGRLSGIAVVLLRDLLLQSASGDLPRLEPQATEGRSYHPRPCAEDLFIHWDRQSAEQVEDLVNAANPDAGGAIAFFKGRILRVLEVSPADGAVPPGTHGGSIVYADPAGGLFVACAGGGMVRINVVKLPEGWLSGGKLAALGFRAGDRFDAAPEAAHSTLSPSFIHH